jgi:hypothetical protein
MASDKDDWAITDAILDVEGFAEYQRCFMWDYAAKVIDTHNMTYDMICYIEETCCGDVDAPIVAAIKQELIDRQNGEGWNVY